VHFGRESVEEGAPEVVRKNTPDTKRWSTPALLSTLAFLRSTLCDTGP
jgi:hypothetical protein